MVGSLSNGYLRAREVRVFLPHILKAILHHLHRRSSVFLHLPLAGTG